MNEPNTINGHTINEVQLDKGGRYLWIPLDPPDGRNWFDTEDSAYLRDLLATPPTMQGLTYHDQDNANGHSDLGTGTLINVENLNNQILIRNLATPHQQSLVLQKLDWTQGNHISMTANDEAWVLVGFYNEYSTTPRQGVFHNELVLVKTDGSQNVRRFAHHRSVYAQDVPGLNNYWNTPRANISKDGRFVAFTSNWGGTNRQDLFIVKIPPP